jgi:tRNA 2-selenouridine synthase
VRDLLVAHYDPIYLQSIRRNFPATAAPLARIAWDGSDAALSSAADAAANSALTRVGSATR